MRIAISCSRSGGHLFPALSLAKRLKEERKDLEIIFFVPESRLSQFIQKSEFKVKPSKIKNFRDIFSVFLFLKESLESFLFLRKFNPDVVIGFGGCASLPLLLEAKVLRIPVIIHEQNVIPGRANRFLSYFADKICVSFLQTKDYFFKLNQKKVIFTGNPLREEIGSVSKTESLKFFDLDLNRFTLLVIGGSQGSRRINSVILETLPYFKENDLQIIHITGFRDYNYVKDYYEKIGFKNFRVFDFLEEIYYAYGAADLVISRAGATAISEITFCGLSSILIPYPYAYGHQKENALFLAKRGAAVLIEDKDLEPFSLKEIISDLKNNKEKLKAMASQSKALGKFDATKRLAGEVLSL